jgi:hypothetical protein
MIKLNLPEFDAKVRIMENQQQIFDVIRRKYVVLTPEEWVRQHFVNYLINHSSYPKGLMTIEKKVIVNGASQRADIVVYSRNGQPLMVVECKAPDIELSNSTFAQAARYNYILGAKYLVITNGVKHFCCKVDLQTGAFSLHKGIPNYQELINNVSE